MADLFEKLKQGIDKGVATVSIKSSTVIETNKIRVHIRTLKEKIEQTKKKLGDMVYAMYLDQTFDQEAYVSTCDAIVQLEKQCQEKEEIIEKIKEQETEILGGDGKTKTCECGAALGQEMAFCVECGKKTQQ